MMALKNDSAAVQMHFVSGNLNVAHGSLPVQPDGWSNCPLRIAQRMRLEQAQLEGVARKMQVRCNHNMVSLSFVWNESYFNTQTAEKFIEFCILINLV